MLRPVLQDMKEGYEPVRQQDDLGQAEEGVQKHTQVAPEDKPCRGRVVTIGLVISLILGAAVFGVCYTFFMYPKNNATAAARFAGAKKVGAGLLFCSEDEVLLLLRNSKHNDSTWGLPGGNVEPGDNDLQATALREATEELGQLPSYSLSTSILTQRGKHNQKHYTVFVAAMTSVDKANYQPQLNHEHREARWWKWADIASQNAPALHPVMKQLLLGSARQELASALPIWPEEDDQAGGEGSQRHRIEKRGAGLLLVNGQQGIFLRRNSSHNNDTWDLPGGNVDLTDRHLEASARREAVEEMGSCPDFQNAGSILTKRGKHDEKHFTVFVGFVSDDVRSRFTPRLSDESLDWQWLDIKYIATAKEVHPRLEELFDGDNKKKLEKILDFGL